MYQVILGQCVLPMTPSKITTSYGGRNETVELINGTQVNIIKSPSLTEISFDFLLPNNLNYPFLSLAGTMMGKLGGIAGAVVGYGLNSFAGVALTKSTILDRLETMMNEKKPFYLIVVRMNEKLTDITFWNAFTKVTLEEYDVIEDAENGLDVLVSVKLKKYVNYGTTILSGDKKSSFKEVSRD